MAQERDQLGEKITQWLAAHPGVEIVDKIVTQSSDEAFHCLAITLFFNEANRENCPARRRGRRRRRTAA